MARRGSIEANMRVLLHGLWLACCVGIVWLVCFHHTHGLLHDLKNLTPNDLYAALVFTFMLGASLGHFQEALAQRRR